LGESILLAKIQFAKRQPLRVILMDATNSSEPISGLGQAALVGLGICFGDGEDDTSETDLMPHSFTRKQ
jgi:hypothetical protein